MNTEPQNRPEVKENIDNENDSMESISLINTKSKVDKAISCATLLWEIYKDNLRKIDNSENNDIIVEIKNNNKYINEAGILVKNYMLDDMLKFIDYNDNQGEKVEKLKEKAKSLELVNTENAIEIRKELDIIKTEINEILSKIKDFPNIIREYNRYSTFLNNMG